MIRLFILIAAALFLSRTSWAQTSLKKLDLEKGTYPVGYKNYHTSDSTRTYSRIYDWNHQRILRPISVSLWYPSGEPSENASTLRILDYLEVLKAEEEWEYLPNEQILNWFYYSNTPENRAHLTEETRAYRNSDPLKGPFPVLIYAPSFQASSIENFALCEYLASHGYIVISSPSRGTETRWFSGDAAMEMETQARDVEFLIREALRLPAADAERIGALGFSFGGLSNTIVQNRNDRIRVLVSLDGTERYRYDVLQGSSFFDPKKLDVPYMHLAQKEIPEIVLDEDGLDPKLNTAFQLYDSISQSRAYRLRFHDLTHSQFSTLGVLFEERDPRQDKSDPEIMRSHKWLSRLTLHFFNTYLNATTGQAAFLPTDGQGGTLISVRTKEPEETSPGFRDFNEAAAEQDYRDLAKSYASMKSKHPNLELPEGNLNNLGLQLVFKPGMSLQGTRVLEFATTLYPTSANLFDSLAEAYLFLGQTEKAVENFQQSLELNPQNGNAIQRLRELKE